MNELSPTEAHCPRCGSAWGLGAPQGLCPRCVMAAGMDTEIPTMPDSLGDPARAAAPLPAEMATHFPQLEILELLGRGGMGWVYKARQTNLDRLVALKVLPPAVAGDPTFAERFQREARALARLNHPNIVAVYDFGQAGPYFYFVMEFVDGANLRQLERARRLSPEEAFAIVPKLCEALQFAHEEGIVHRDIKPENILIDGRGRLKIADFGIAKLAGPKEDITLTGTRHAIGTPHYMAPEQFETPGKVDHRADIYALGVVFYEMLTGELPMGRFEAPSKMLEVDVRVDEVVLRSLERNPERRYQTANAVKSDVEALTQAAPANAAPLPADAAATPDDFLVCNPLVPANPAASPPADPGAFSLLGRAWRDWWSERARWFPVSVQTVLVLLHLGCLIGFIATQISGHWQSDGHRRFTYTVGAVEPWFKFETYPTSTIPFRSGIEPTAGSLLFLVVGFALYYAVWRIEKIRKPKAGFWSSPAAMGILWALFTIAAVGMGMKMGHDALKDDTLGGLLAPQLRSAMAISDVNDHDEALRTVALQSAGAKDIKTVRRAILEIRANELHDRTAAECALVLVKLKNGATDSYAVAGDIRSNSLRDATLAQIAATPPTD